jgi:NitT/TauT family transport system substrate-binding protein
MENGSFARHLPPGVQVEPLVMNAGPAVIEAIFAGGVDVAYIGPNPALNGYVRSRGEALRVLAGATAGGAGLVVRSGITGPTDLRGKTVASPQLGNTQDVALRHWLQANGLKTTTSGSGDVSVVPRQNAEILETFRSGQLDGAWVPEPWLTRLINEVGGRLLVDERTLWPDGLFATTLLVARTDFLRQHPELVAALVAGHLEATTFVTQNPDDAQRVVNAYLERLTGRGLPPATLAEGWSRMAFTVEPMSAPLRQSAEHAEALALLDRGGTSLDGLYDLGPLNQALAAAGRPPVHP